MSAAETVAKLNRIGGKSTPAQSSRFQPRLSGMFSPEKSQNQSEHRQQDRRGSGKLQRRKSSRNGSTTTRRNSLSLPGDEEQEDDGPVLKTKKKSTLKRSGRNSEQSPLKKHGYNIQLENNPRVNLNDSPAKNTRSKMVNPLDVLANTNLPATKSLVKGTKRHAKQPDAIDRSVPEGSTLKRKATRDSDVDQLSNQEQIIKRVKQTGDSAGLRRDREGDHAEAAENGDDIVANALQADGHQNSTPKRKRGRPSKSRTQVKTKEKEMDELTQQSLKIREQLEQATREENDEFERSKEDFVRHIKAAVQIHRCAEEWSAVGGAARMIQAKVSPDSLESVRGKAIFEKMKSLSSYYREVRLKRIMLSEVEKNIWEQTTELKNLCQKIEKTDSPKEDRTLVKDLFSYIIPKSVMLLKHLLRVRCDDGKIDEAASNELVALVDLAIDICNRARAWEPAPSTLESGIKRYVKNDILAGLRRIRAAFQPSLNHYAFLEKDREERERLKPMQEAAKKQQQEVAERRRLALQYCRLPRRDVTARVQQESHTDALDGGVIDIDEIVGDPQILQTTEQDVPLTETRVSTTLSLGKKPPLRREPTADLPPPSSIILSEAEKVALLNGLQRYTGKDRYNEILNDEMFGNILGERDLDDLMEAARSFSQMMASKMGIDVYRADKSLWWLRSTDPEARDRDSVEL